MTTKAANGVGRFAVDFEVANYGDMKMARRGLLPAEQKPWIYSWTASTSVSSPATRAGPFLRSSEKSGLLSACRAVAVCILSVVIQNCEEISCPSHGRYF